MRTKEEIEKEIAALKALKPCGSFASYTAKTLNLIIKELEEGFDITSGEFACLTEGRRELVDMARYWKYGSDGTRPSEGWGPLVSPP